MNNKHVDPSSGATPHGTSLVYKTCAQVAELQEAFKAYIALEHLISPEHEDEEESLVPPSRAELGALLHTLNAEILRWIKALTDTTARLQAACASPPDR